MDTISQSLQPPSPFMSLKNTARIPMIIPLLMVSGHLNSMGVPIVATAD